MTDPETRLTPLRRAQMPRLPDALGGSAAGAGPAHSTIVDFVTAAARRGTEPRDPQAIADIHAPGARVFDDVRLRHGTDEITEGPDLVLSVPGEVIPGAEHVIWAGDAGTGFHTSHRMPMVARRVRADEDDDDDDAHRASGRVGNRDVLVIANGLVRDGAFHVVHVLRNTAALLLADGRDPMEEAARAVRDGLPDWPRDAATWDALRMAAAPSTPLHLGEPVEGFDPDRFTREVHQRIWALGDVSAPLDYHAADIRFEGPSLRHGVGMDAHAAMTAAIRAELSQIAFRTDDVFWTTDADGVLRLATRWSMDAVHSGDLAYGQATGAAVQIWGITQSEVIGGRIVAEWMLFNEFDVMMQIAAARIDGRTG